MRWRSYMFLALLVGEASFATASESQPRSESAEQDVRVVHVQVPGPAELPPWQTDAVLAHVDTDLGVDLGTDLGVESGMDSGMDSGLDLDVVRWTVPEAMPLALLATQWGLGDAALVELNPHLADAALAPAGASLVVFVDDPAVATQSVGSPNRGRLVEGIPMPEGPYWRLRDRRVRAYGTEGTVRSLVAAMTTYGQAHPDGPPIRLGELSARRGGRARPHVSHRTGRDVDIGYVMKPGTLGERYWRRADETTLDVEKTWTLVKALADTGRVQQMFISSQLQGALKAYARTVETDDELAKYFRIPSQGPEQRYLITHENGHRDHLHVRFRCDDDDLRCRGDRPSPIAAEPPRSTAPPVRATAAVP